MVVESLAFDAWTIHRKAWPRNPRGELTRKDIAREARDELDLIEFELCRSLWRLLHPTEWGETEESCTCFGSSHICATCRRDIAARAEREAGQDA